MINNKGITTVEILVCFVLVTIIVSSLYSTVSMFNEKRMEENNKLKVIVYSNTLTKKIQDDFIKYGLSYVKIQETTGDGTRKHEVEFTLKNGETRMLIITQIFTKSSIHLDGAEDKDDSFMIEYGSKSEYGGDDTKLVRYPLPELGETYGKYETDIKAFSPCKKGETDCHILKDLQINNVLINVSNEQTSDDVGSHVLSIYIGFYHPELGNRYAINIICPIDYQNSLSNKLSTFDFKLERG